MATKSVTYLPYPTMTAMHQGITNQFRYVAGPPGSGKSVGCFMDLLAIALRQEPDPDGIRPTRFAVIRSTYGELEETTLETMKSWLPIQYTKYVHTKPLKVHTRMPLPDGTIADIQFRLIAIGGEEDLGKLDSAEYTAIWLNELTGLPAELVGKAGERVGRYPPANRWPDGKSHVTYYGVIGDYNYPPKDHWIVDFLHSGELPENSMLYEQPPALLDHVDPETEVVTYEINPEAENLVNLDDGKKYMLDLANYQKLGKLDMISTRLLCRYGKAGGDGKKVFNNFDRKRHVSEEPLKPAQLTDVLVSVDTSGLHPCAIFWQYVRSKWQIIDGVYGEDMGFEEFVDDVITPIMTMRYPECDSLFVCDPANARGSNTKVSPTELLIDRGYRAIVATTNAFKPRKDAVESLLHRQGAGSLLITKSLGLLIDALEGAYQYKKLVVKGSSEQFSSKPDKNKYSHWADAVQYGALHIIDGMMSDEDKDLAARVAAASARRRR